MGNTSTVTTSSGLEIPKIQGNYFSYDTSVLVKILKQQHYLLFNLLNVDMTYIYENLLA